MLKYSPAGFGDQLLYTCSCLSVVGGSPLSGNLTFREKSANLIMKSPWEPCFCLSLYFAHVYVCVIYVRMCGPTISVRSNWLGLYFELDEEARGNPGGGTLLESC